MPSFFISSSDSIMKASTRSGSSRSSGRRARAPSAAWRRTGAAGADQVGALEVLLVDQEVLLGADGREDALVLLVAEQAQGFDRRARAHPSSAAAGLASSACRSGRERGRDAEQRPVRSEDEGLVGSQAV
jgi:hypothetical protein